jgi:membrane protease YdiL (CAAX protease family)
MGISIDPAAWPGFLAVYEAIALTLLATVLSLRKWRKVSDNDLRAARRYFASFFLVGAVGPLALFFLLQTHPLASLGLIGIRFGRWPLGLILTLIAIPIALLAGSIGSRDPEMRAFYPFSKKACADVRTFIAYEIRYFLLYYTGWEFVFRGVLFFPLVETAGLVPALAFQTIASTLFHIGHPETEIFAALGAGFAFGLIAWWTGSILYPILIHASVGISTDTFIFRSLKKEPAVS